MNYDLFREKLLSKLEDNVAILQNEDKHWVVKGFIDTYKNIYTISVDTKVVSKIIELMLFPIISQFAFENQLNMEFAKHQNHYPDITFIDNNDNSKFAMDIKTTYRINDDKVNGFTLGAFTGYFRNRDSTKNITYPYDSYSKHLVLGVIYNKQDDEIDERKIYSLDDIDSILSVISNFEFILNEKYKIASSRPGSGNTKNIGSITNISNLKNGNGPFSKLGLEIFDDYWMYYQTNDMNKDGKSPYCNLEEYSNYKQKAPNIKIIKDAIGEDE